jgi:hypothetical protein
MWNFWMHCHTAHLTDLVLDRPADGRRSLDIAQQSVDGQAFESPRFFLWISELRQLLYEENSSAATRQLDLTWPMLVSSSMLRINHYKWMAYCIRLCCHLSDAKRVPQQKAASLKQAAKCIRVLLKLNEPNFNTIAKAQALVVEAAHGRVASQQEWEAVVLQLRTSKLDLYAMALAWHQALYAPADVASAMQEQAEQAFLARGCAAPRKLMQLILPLP